MARRRFLRIVIIVAVIVALGAAVIWALSPDAQAPAPVRLPSATPSALASPATPPLQIVTSGDRLASAVAAAFPRGASAPGADGERYLFKSHKLVETEFGPVLVSEGQAQDAAHVTSGRLDIAYLRAVDAGFVVAKQFPAAVEIGSFGQMGDWDVSSAFADVPTIRAEGGSTGQGYTCGATVLTQLRPDGPVKVADLQTVYDDSGATVDRAARSIEGKLVNIDRGRGFDVRYTGSKSFTEHYALEDGHYVRQGTTALPEC